VGVRGVSLGTTRQSPTLLSGVVERAKMITTRLVFAPRLRPPPLNPSGVENGAIVEGVMIVGGVVRGVVLGFERASGEILRGGSDQGKQGNQCKPESREDDKFVGGSAREPPI
jgi:hypothetical protein